MAYIADRITRHPVVASMLSVSAACFGGVVGFLMTGFLQPGESIAPDMMAGVIEGAFGLVLVGVLVGGFPALGVLLVFVWPSLLILNRGLKMKPVLAIGVTWITAMAIQALVALFATGGDLPMWQYLLTPMVGTTFGALVLASFAVGPRDVDVDIPWRRD